jgi:rhodanese-related sulfurtransferase
MVEYMNRKPLYIALSLAALACLPTGCATTDTMASSAAEASIKPKEGWYRHLVGYAEVKPHAELPKDYEVKGTVLLVDSRPAARRYDVGHIPGAINIPDTQFDKLAPAMLPKDKATPIIFYCQGFECDLSHKSAAKAEALGYSNVKVYPAGIPDWQARGELVAVSLAHIQKLQAEKADFMLIDSRPERVFGQGSIPGAVNISDSKFDKETAKLPADKNKTLIFFCGGLKCDLSSKSAVKAKALGYKNVFVYPPGQPEWQAKVGGAKAAGPVAAVAQAAQAAAGTMARNAGTMAGIAIEAGKEKGSISTSSFERILKENPSQIVVIDVRDEKDVKKGTFPGALNIPINELEKKIGTLPKDKPVVFTCATGARSGEAYDTVKMLAGDVKAYFLDADVSCDGNACKVKPH